MSVEGRVSSAESQKSSDFPLDTRLSTLLLNFSRLHSSHFPQPAQVSFGLTVLSRQKRLYKVPSHSRSYRPAAHAKDVHVIVLDSLLGGEMIVDKRGANTPNFVGAHRRANPTATDGHTAIHLSSDHRLRQREHIVGIVIAFAQSMGTKISDFMAGVVKLSD